MGALYMVSFPNGKAYVGITAQTAAERFGEHVYNARKDSRKLIHRAIRKYGSEQVTLRTLVFADNWEYLCDLERRAIAAFGTRAPFGYNATAGGEGTLGYKHTLEALRKIGVIHKGKAHHTQPHSAAAKAKMRAAALGKPKTPEHRANIRRGLLGNKYVLGHKQSAAHKAAISAGNKGNKWNAEQKARMSAVAFVREADRRLRGAKRRPQTAEHIAKRVASRRARFGGAYQ